MSLCRLSRPRRYGGGTQFSSVFFGVPVAACSRVSPVLVQAVGDKGQYDDTDGGVRHWGSPPGDSHRRNHCATCGLTLTDTGQGEGKRTVRTGPGINEGLHSERRLDKQ